MVNEKKKNKYFTRYTAIVAVAFLIFAALMTRLVFMQIVDYQDYVDQSNTDALKQVSEAGPRGDITDRNGVKLATDIQSYILTFMETDESKKAFFDTMEKVFKNLDDKKELQFDDFELKINPYRFDFDSTDTKVIQTRELRFKKDRGLDVYVMQNSKNTNWKNSSYNDLGTKEQAKVDAELLKITPEQTFNILWDQYTSDYTKKYTSTKGKTLNPLYNEKVAKYTVDEKRRFMLVKDALHMQSFSGYKPITIAKNISRDSAFIFQEKASDLPGIDISQQPTRSYPYGELASAVIGNISRINPVNKEKYEEQGYDVNTDLIGVSGLEGALESRLKGTKGVKLVEVNKTGRITKEKFKMDPYPGETVQTTISKDVQEIAEKSLQKAMDALQVGPEVSGENTHNANRGAVVVLNANTGEVLSLVSKPGFDPNIFSLTGGLTTEQNKLYFAPDLETWGRNFIKQRGLVAINTEGKNEDQILDWLFPVDKTVKSARPTRKDDKDIYPKPFLNYATSSLIPSGSTFKPVTAIAGLETGVIDQYTSVDDEEYFDDGKGFHTPFPNEGHNGIVTLKRAIQVSSNPYFMTVGQKLRAASGDDILAEYAWKLGLGVKPNSGIKPATGIEINESFGQVYNVFTNKNMYATLYLDKTMQVVKSGKGTSNNSFPAIDLYDNDNDEDNVRDLKKQIKDSIKNSIRTGAMVKSAYKALITKLVASDEIYKNANIKASDISTVVEEIYAITINDAYNQITSGANIYNASIGQGLNQFTPLQLADYIATLVNGGNRYKVHLVDKILDADGTVLQQNKPEILNTTGFKQSNIDLIKEGMKGVTGDGGTAAVAFENLKNYMESGGKTGSATFDKLQKQMGRSSYSFFVGFAPYDKPEIAVCAVIFDGGYGSSAAPVVRDVYEAYFKDKLKSQNFVPEEDYLKEYYAK